MIKEIINYLLSLLMNQRGQLGMYPPNISIGNPGSFEETTEYSPFETSSVSPQYGDLIARYQALMGGGAGSMQSYLDLQRKTGLEQLRNTQASRGLGSRSGVGVAAASQFLGQFEPRAAMQQAEYMKGLIGDYGSAVSQGRTTRSALPTKTVRKAAPSAQEGKASSPFQYLDRSGAPSGGGGGATSRAGSSALGSSPSSQSDEGAYGAFGTGGYSPGGGFIGSPYQRPGGGDWTTSGADYLIDGQWASDRGGNEEGLIEGWKPQTEPGYRSTGPSTYQTRTATGWI